MTMPRRYRATAVGLGALALVAGCGSAGDDTARTATPAALASITTSPTPTDLDAEGDTTPTEPASPTGRATPIDPATPASPTVDTTGPSTASAGRRAAAALPTEPGAYGEALLAAWSARNPTKIKRLAAPSAAASLTKSAAVKGLLRTACEDDMCSWSNEAGRRVTMTFHTAKVAAGRPQAVTAVKIS